MLYLSQIQAPYLKFLRSLICLPFRVIMNYYPYLVSAVNSLSAHSFFGTKVMSNKQIFRIAANILTFESYVRNKHNLTNDPYQILSSCLQITDSKMHLANLNVSQTRREIAASHPQVNPWID